MPKCFTEFIGEKIFVKRIKLFNNLTVLKYVMPKLNKYHHTTQVLET